MNLKEALRKKVDDGRANAQAVWKSMTRHHEDYVRVLELSSGDLEELERQKGRIGMYPTLEDELCCAVHYVDVSGETFGLAVKKVCGNPYGGEWATYLMLGCRSNPDLNNSEGEGTTLIFAVSDKWHKRVMSQLVEKNTPSSE